MTDLLLTEFESTYAQTDHLQALSDSKSLANPFQKLPPELVSRIFESQDWSSLEGYLNSPLLLGGVCKLWRHIAWSTPSLWTVASFLLTSRVCSRTEYTGPQAKSQPSCESRHSPTSDLDMASRVRLFKEYIDRSGALGLTLQVHHTSFAYNREVEELKPLVEAINHCAFRWYNLRFILPTSLWNLLGVYSTASPHPSDAWAGPPLPHLRYLSLSRMVGQQYGGTQWITFQSGDLPRCFVRSLPQLNKLSLHGVHLNPSSVEGAWNNLRSVDVDSWPLNACLEVILKAPLLQSATFTFVQQENHENTHRSLQSHPIVREALQEVILNCLSGVEADKFFDALTLPSLESLSLSAGGLSAASVISMLDRSGSRSESESGLQKFTLKNCSWGTEGLCNFLTKSPRLTSISIRQFREVGQLLLDPDRIFQTIFKHQTLLEELVYRGTWQPTGGWKFLQHIPRPGREVDELKLRVLTVSLVPSDRRLTEDVKVIDQPTKAWVRDLFSAELSVSLMMDCWKIHLD